MRNRDLGRLYALLPATLRARDFDEGQPLEALMALLASELEVVEGDIDALYENWFIETCEDWVVPYIGDLLGVRPLRPFGTGTGMLRAHVANTLGYRRAKGTAAALEQLARDVSGWPVHAVEFFQRLIQSQQLNHPRQDALGTVSLRNAELALSVGGPFETACHNAEVRSIAAETGRYNIPSLGLFVWRLQSYYLGFNSDAEQGYLGAVTPRPSPLGAGLYHLDPLGRDLTLYNRPLTEESLSSLSGERHVPAALSRRRLHADLNSLRALDPQGGLYFKSLPVVSVRLDGNEVPAERLFSCALDERDDGLGGTTWRRPGQAGRVLFDPELGRLSLHASDAGLSVEVAYAYAFPHDLGGGPYDRRESIETFIEPLREGTPPLQIGVTRRQEEHAPEADADGPVVASLALAIALWNDRAQAGSRGIIALMDSASYGEPLDPIRVPPGARLALVAAGWPVEELPGGLRVRTAGVLAPQDRRPHLHGHVAVIGEATATESPGTLIIDGLVVEGELRVAPGDLGELIVRHSTLGASASGLGPGIRVMAGVAGDNTRLALTLDHSISGLIAAMSVAGRLSVVASILGEDRESESDPALAPHVLIAPEADLEIEQSTVFGRMQARTLEASDCLFTGHLAIARRQQGCVRFSYVPPGSRTPRRYRCAPDATLASEAERLHHPLEPAEAAAVTQRVRPRFASSAFGEPHFAALSLACARELCEGAENGAAMGAHYELGEPFRRANLRDALDEYLPLALEAGVVFVT